MAGAGQGGGLPPQLGYHFMQQMHSDFLHFDSLHPDHPHLEGELSFSPVRAVAPRLIADPAAGFEPPVTFEPITTTWNRFNSQPRVTLDARSVRRASGPTETTIWNQLISHAGTSYAGIRIFAIVQRADGEQHDSDIMPELMPDESDEDDTPDLAHDILPDLVSDESDVDDMPDLAPPPGPAVSGV